MGNCLSIRSQIERDLEKQKSGSPRGRYLSGHLATTIELPMDWSMVFVRFYHKKQKEKPPLSHGIWYSLTVLPSVFRDETVRFGIKNSILNGFIFFLIIKITQVSLGQWSRYWLFALFGSWFFFRFVFGFFFVFGFRFRHRLFLDVIQGGFCGFSFFIS